MDFRRALSLLVFLPLLGSCTLVTVDSKSGPARIESRGLIDGHAAVGIPKEERLIHADLFGGESDGAIAELVIWKLFRLEVGLAGASVSLGPLHLGLGVLFYEPEVPKTGLKDRGPEPTRKKQTSAQAEHDADDCAECRAVLEG